MLLDFFWGGFWCLVVLDLLVNVYGLDGWMECKNFKFIGVWNVECGRKLFFYMLILDTLPFL